MQYEAVFAALSLLLLQYVALAGVLGLLQSFRRDRSQPPAVKDAVTGCMLGSAGLFLSALSTDTADSGFAHAPLLFFAGLLAGWRGAAACLALFAAAHLITSGSGVLTYPAVTLDMAGLAAGGSVTNLWVRKHNVHTLTASDIVRIWAGYTVLIILTPLPPLWLGITSAEIAAAMMVRRVLLSPFALLLFVTLLVLLRRDAGRQSNYDGFAGPEHEVPMGDAVGEAPPETAGSTPLDESIQRDLSRWILSASPPLKYQSKHLLGTREIVGAEALLRPTDADGRPLAPGEVLAMVHRLGLTREFEWCTIEAVVRDLAHLNAGGWLIPLSVNVSAISLQVPKFGDRISALLQSAGVPPATLTLEITEVSRIPDQAVVRKNLDRLRTAGVRLSLDDFGTGYSALSILANHPFNEVKIDHSFISQLEDPRMRSAVSLALTSAQVYDADLVAEGIETEHQLGILDGLGVRFGQGFLFSAAQPLDALLAASDPKKIAS